MKYILGMSDTEGKNVGKRNPKEKKLGVIYEAK